MSTLLAQTYFELARQDDEKAKTVIKAMLVKAILVGDPIPDSYWQELIRIKGRLAIEMMPENWQPGSSTWHCILMHNDPQLSLETFKKYPDSFKLSDIPEDVFEAVGENLKLPITPSHLGNKYASVRSAKLVWVAANNPAMFHELVRSNGLDQVSDNPGLLNRLTVQDIIQLIKNQFGDRLNWENILNRILPEMREPYYLSELIGLLLKSICTFPSHRANHQESKAVQAFMKLKPASYMEWIRLQHLGGMTSGDLVTGRPMAGMSSQVPYPMLKDANAHATMFRHWELIAANPALHQYIDLKLEELLIATPDCRVSVDERYEWPYIRAVLKEGTAYAQDLANRIVNSYIHSPGVMLYESRSLPPIAERLPMQALAMLHEYKECCAIMHPQFPVSYFSLLLQKPMQASLRNKLLDLAVVSQNKDLVTYCLSTEDVHLKLQTMNNIGDSVHSYLIKPHPANLEILIAKCRNSTQYEDQRLFSHLINKHPAPPSDLLQDAIMQDCPRFKVRHLKDWEVITLARMARLANKKDSFAVLNKAVIRRKLDIESAPKMPTAT